MMLLWGVRWNQKNKARGVFTHLIMTDTITLVPLVFRTKREAQEWIDKNYGYIRLRPDLRREPHGWKMPSAVRVKVVEL